MMLFRRRCSDLPSSLESCMATPSCTRWSSLIQVRYLTGLECVFFVVLMPTCADVPNTETGRYDNYCHQLMFVFFLSFSSEALLARQS